MPSPKVGTVTFDVGPTVKSVKAGRAEFRVDKEGNVHAPVGKKSFGPKKIYENVMAMIQALNKAKPATSKGVYLRSAAVSATMGPAVKLDLGPVRL
jgi:large subunit ribosomal protein L1